MKEKINILHIVADREGGIFNVVKDIKNMEKSGFNIASNVAIYQDVQESLFKKYKRFKKRYLSHYQDTDIIHLHGAWTPHLLPLTCKPKIPFLISPHGAFHKVSLQKSIMKKRVVFSLYMKKVFNNADCFHALTQKEAADIQNSGFADRPIAIIPNGLDFNKEITISQKKKNLFLELAKGRKIYLSLSRLHESKGIDILIDSFEKLLKKDPLNTLLIAGSGAIKYKKSLEEKIKIKNLGDAIFLVGELENEEKYSAYDVADVFVLPSFNEGFGLTVLEAFRQNAAVITTTQTPFLDIEKHQAGWCVKPEKEEMYKALKSASDATREELLKMGMRGHGWMKSEYSIDSVNRKYEALYVWLKEKKNTPMFIVNT